MDKKVFGYARVSSCEQNEDRQIIALKEMGVPEKQIYVDKQSGKDFDRPQYRKLLRKLDENSILFVKSIDRLGRNYADLNEQWRKITKEKGADIVVIDMPLLDTRREKNLLGTLISDIVLALLSYVAENENDQNAEQFSITCFFRYSTQFYKKQPCALCKSIKKSLSPCFPEKNLIY